MNAQTEHLLRAFLEADGMDFKPIRATPEWVNFRLDKIKEAILGQPLNQVHVVSRNICLITRKLEFISPNWSAGATKSMFVSLCDCGRNEHWGTIEVR